MVAFKAGFAATTRGGAVSPPLSPGIKGIGPSGIVITPYCGTTEFSIFPESLVLPELPELPVLPELLSSLEIFLGSLKESSLGRVIENYLPSVIVEKI